MKFFSLAKIGHSISKVDPDTVREQIEDALDHGLDGIIVYVDQTGKIPAFYSAGWKDKVAQAPADPRALFKIASIHKLYIAAAASKLSEDEQAVYSSIYDLCATFKAFAGFRTACRRSVTSRLPIDSAGHRRLRLQQR